MTRPPVAIRPIEPEDRERLVEGFERLSPESRYRRFFAAIPRLTSRQLDYLTQVDHHDHEALVAIDPGSGRLVGVARYARTGPGVAEPAIVVADDWHGRGVASELLDRLVQRAIDEGVERFEAPVLASNAEAIHVLRRLGDTTIEHRGIESELTIELRPPAPASPLRALLRAVAEGVVDPALTIWHRSAPRRGLPSDALENVVVADADAAEAAGEIVRARGARLVIAPRGPRDLAAQLLDLAHEHRARLVVVADDAEDEGVAGRLLGSAWDHVSHHAPCDVLITRRR